MFPNYMQNIPYNCSSCPAVFSTFQEIMAHELQHMSLRYYEKREKKENNKKMKRNISERERDLDKDMITTTLLNCPDGKELNVLCQMFQPEPAKLESAFTRISADLKRALEKDGIWELLPFGSTITGLALKTSDVDFFTQPLNENDSDPKVILQRVTKLLTQNRNFIKIVPIHQARVPIVKCSHLSTGYNIDIAISSRIGYHSTQAVSCLLQTDSRIHPLMLIIKIWAKNWNLTGTGLLTNYCLLLLIVFSLQNCEPKIVVPIKDLQEQEPLIYEDGIPFSLNVNKMKIESNYCIKELLKNFFEFYKNFDFADNIISPCTGKAILRSYFHDYFHTIPEYILYQSRVALAINGDERKIQLYSSPMKLKTPMVVQDPFCLNQNKAGNVTNELFHRFRELIDHAYYICSEDQQKPSKLLVRLLYENPNERTHLIGPSTSFNKEKLLPLKISSVCKFSPVESELVYVRIYLRKSFPTKSFDKIDINKFWTEKIIEFTIDLVTNFLKIKIDLYQPEKLEKSPKIVGQTNVYSNKYSLNCKISTSLDLWTGRKNESRKGCDNFFKEQSKATEKLTVERSANPIILSANLKLDPEPDFAGILLTLEDLAPKSAKNRFKSFAHEFNSRLRCFFRAYFEKLATGN